MRCSSLTPIHPTFYLIASAHAALGPVHSLYLGTQFQCPSTEAPRMTAARGQGRWGYVVAPAGRGVSLEESRFHAPGQGAHWCLAPHLCPATYLGRFSEQIGFNHHHLCCLIKMDAPTKRADRTACKALWVTAIFCRRGEDCPKYTVAGSGTYLVGTLRTRS